MKKVREVKSKLQGAGMDFKEVIVRATGTVERPPIITSGYFTPGQVIYRVKEGVPMIEWQMGYAQIITKPFAACLVDFLSLAEGPDNYTDVVAFVKEWGALAICPEVEDGIGPEGRPEFVYRESAETYREIALTVSAILRIAADLSEGDCASKEDWEAAGLGSRIDVPDNVLDPKAFRLWAERGTLALYISCWLADVGVVAGMTWRGDNPSAVLIPGLAHTSTMWDIARRDGNPIKLRRYDPKQQSYVENIVPRPGGLAALLALHVVAIIMSGVRRCARCDKIFPPEYPLEKRPGRRPRYCPTCAREKQKEQKRSYIQSRRSAIRQIKQADVSSN